MAMFQKIAKCPYRMGYTYFMIAKQTQDRIAREGIFRYAFYFAPTREDRA